MVKLNKSIIDVYRRFFDPYVIEMIENQQSLFFKKKNEVISLEKKNLTIVFWDLSGFSNLFNLIRSQYEVTLFLEQYFGLADQFIHKYNGVLNKFIGDGILAIFGLVTTNSDNSLGAIDAVNCAIELRNIFGKMKSNWIKLWHLHFGYDDMRIDLKCGINSGEVLFGRLGTDNRDEITVVGRVVNLASRLECKARLNQILISKETNIRVNSKFNSKPIEVSRKRPLKGFPQVKLYYKILDRNRSP